MGLDNGNFLLLWRDSSDRDGSGTGVFAQLFQNDGTRVGTAFQVNEEFSSTQSQPEAVDLGAGRVMVVWTSASSGSAGDGNSNGVFGRIFDATGTPEAGEFQINSTTSGDQSRPQVTQLPGGDVIVTWEDRSGNDGNQGGIFAQRVDSTGALVSFDGTTAGADEQVVNTVTTGEQRRPDVTTLEASATLPSGGFVITWDGPDSSAVGVYAQIYNHLGAPQGGEIFVSAASTSSSQYDAVVHGTPGGGFTVTWSDSSGVDGSGTGVVAQRVLADGTLDGPAFVVNQEVSSTQHRPDIAVLNNGATVIAWSSTSSGSAGDGSSSGVFQTLIDLPAPAAGAMAPVLEGVEETVTFDENAANAAAQLLNQDGALSLTDMDSPDFDGGSILVHRIVGSTLNSEALRGATDGLAQENYSVVVGNGVTLSGNQVLFNGNVIGTIVQDGTGGAPLEIDLSSANATPEAVEALLAQIGYQNLPDDPQAQRQIAIQVTDGDGGSTGTQVVTINITPETDAAAVRQGAEEQVNTFTPGSQNAAASSEIFDSLGNQIGYVTVWVSADQDRVQDNTPGIFGQRFDLNGNPVGGEFQVNAFSESTQDDPTVVGLPTGGFVVGWGDNSSSHPAAVAAGDTSASTIAQIFDENGGRVGTEFLINEQVSSTQNQPELAAKANGNIVAVYTDHSGADGSGQGVFLREFDNTGTATALGASVQVNTETSSTQSAADVIVLNGGRVLVTWTSTTSSTAGDGSGDGVFARLFEANGTPVGTEFQVNSNTASFQYDVRAAALSDGTFVLTWNDNSGIDGSQNAVMMQRFDANGTPIGGEVLVNGTTTSSQFDPYVVALDTGGWVIAWSDNGNGGNGQDIFAQIFDANGARVDGEFPVNLSGPSTEEQPTIVALPGGGFTISWTSVNSGSHGDGNSNGIFQQIFAPNGTVLNSSDPVLTGVTPTVVLDEADVNTSGQLIADVAALGDADSADFDGGQLTVSMVINDVVQAQFAAPDNATQDQLGIDTSGNVAFAGATVSVNGTAIGTVSSDGVNGSNLVIDLNSAATPNLVEQVIRALTYGNTSDDPETARKVAIQITDGDGGFVREVVDITITPETDGGVVVGDEVQTNSFTTGNQSDSHVATLADGGYVVVWTSNNQDATGDGQNGVFAQRYDASGAPVGGEIQVNTNASGSQSNAQVVGLSTGGFAIAWEDQSGLIGTDFDEEIAIQVFDSNGQKVGAEIAVPSTSHNNPDNPALAAFDNGDFVLVRNGQNPSNSFIDEIFVQRFNDAGGTVETETSIAPAGSNFTNRPDVAVQSDGTYVVVFTARNLDNPGDNDDGVFLQRYAADNSQIGGPIQVNTINRFTQFEPRVAATEDGGYVVVYTSDTGDDSSYSNFGSGVYAQRFDGLGNTVGSEFLVNEVVDGTQSQPDVVGLQGGGFAVSFSDNNSTDGSGWGVFLQQYDAQANRVDGPVQINQQASSTQSEGAIAALPGGNVVVSWTSADSGSAGDGSSNGVFHRLLGDPGDFSQGGDPVLEGVNRTVTYTENTLNGVPQLIDANGTAAVSDPDSADFDGGSILVSNVISSAPLIDQINSPDDLTQDQLGLRQTSQITISGSDVSVGGNVVAQIVQSGQDGAPFELQLTANADAAIVELLVENLTYRNISNDPLPVRELRIQITDGDGGASDPALVTVNITPTPDAAQPVGGEVTVNDTVGAPDENPVVVQLPGTGGDFVVVWEKLNTTGAGDGDRDGIFAQRFDVNGNKLNRDGTGLASGASDEFQINTTTAQDQFSPTVAAFSDGSFVVAWTGDAQDGSGTGIIYQLFNADGTLNGAERVANSGTSGSQTRPDVAVLNDDTFVVTWQSPNSGGAGDGNGEGVLARHFDNTGAPVGLRTSSWSTPRPPALNPTPKSPI